VVLPSRPRRLVTVPLHHVHLVAGLMSNLLVLAAVLAAAVATLIGFGRLDWSHFDGWLALAVFFLACGMLVPPFLHLPWPRRPPPE
jgi:hypothetical protein